MPDQEPAFDPADITGGPQLPAHLYLHVPFCRVKCSYCDFYSTTDLSSARIEMVLRGIEAEITQWQAASLPGVVETLYLGGGTPSVITGGAVRLIDYVRSRFPLRAGAEITVEANPDSITPALVEALAAAGVTRMSVGVQSLVADELAMLGRVHTVDEALASCETVRAAGIDLSVDLMCGIPGQTPASWEVTLERALETGAAHVSVYPLSLEEGTPLAVACDSGLVAEPDPDLAARMMERAEEVLTAAGLPRYEVANYAVPERESRHNLAYWTGRAYIGCGPAAHSMLDAETAVAVGLLTRDRLEAGSVRVRSGEPADIDAWLTTAGSEIEVLDGVEAAREDVMLGLRLVRGVPEAQVAGAGLVGVLESLERDDLVECKGGRWRTTRRGWLLGNEVFGRVWAGE